MTDLLRLAFALISGFVGGVMYTRDVYAPLVEWYQKSVRRDKW